MYIYIYIFVYIYVYIYIYVFMYIYICIYVYIYIYIAMATGTFKSHMPVLNKNCANRYVKSPEGFYSTGILLYNLKLRFPLGGQWF